MISVEQLIDNIVEKLPDFDVDGRYTRDYNVKLHGNPANSNILISVTDLNYTDVQRTRWFSLTVREI